MTLAIILIVVLAVGFLVAIRIVGINHGENNPEEDCSEEEVVLSEEDKGKIRITRRYAFLVDTGDLSPNKAKAIIERMRRAYKNGKLDFNDDFINIEDDVDGVLIFPVSKWKEEDCSEEEVMSASEIRKLSIEERKPILERAAKRTKDEGDNE